MFYEMLDGKRDQVFVLSQTGDGLQIDQRKMEQAFALCCKLENCIQDWRKQHMVELLDGWSKKLGFTKTKKRGLMKRFGCLITQNNLMMSPYCKFHKYNVLLSYFKGTEKSNETP